MSSIAPISSSSSSPIDLEPSHPVSLDAPVTQRTLFVTASAVTLLVAGLIVHFGLRVERALLSALSPASRSAVAQPFDASTPAPSASQAQAGSLPLVNPGLTNPGPLTAEQFSTQWEGRFAATAEEKCWKPHFAKYDRLPGHLDLALQIAPSGQLKDKQLVGFTNPGDSPDPGLVKQVFDCVVALIQPLTFPPQPEAYIVRGRVNRPNPPPGYRPPLPASPPPVPEALEPSPPRP